MQPNLVIRLDRYLPAFPSQKRREKGIAHGRELDVTASRSTFLAFLFWRGIPRVSRRCFFRSRAFLYRLRSSQGKAAGAALRGIPYGTTASRVLSKFFPIDTVNLATGWKGCFSVMEAIVAKQRKRCASAQTKPLYPNLSSLLTGGKPASVATHRLPPPWKFNLQNGIVQFPKQFCALSPSPPQTVATTMIRSLVFSYREIVSNVGAFKLRNE